MLHDEKALDEKAMPLLDSLCRKYQSFFNHNHPEEAKLVELHSTGKIPEFLDAYFEHEYRKGVEVVARFSAITTAWQNGKSLDFGCGAGGLTYRIAEKSNEVVGIDLEEFKIEFARKQSVRLNANNVQFICYDGGNVPLEDACFDCIFCIDVVEHLPTPEKFIHDFYRLLKPGGFLLLSFGPPWGHAHGKHMWAKLPGWWTHLLFPQSVVMRVSGFPETATWEELGMHRLTVRKFEKIIRLTKFERIHQELLIKKILSSFKFVPFIRELFISEVVGVYRKPLLV